METGGGPHPGGQPILDLGVLPVADDDLARLAQVRVQMKPNSRSPWAAWLRFMKSMSIVDQGRSRLNCVCRWTNGFCRAVSPAIHILAGEKVCIQSTRPAQLAAELASRQTSRIDCGVVTSGLKTTRTGRRPEALSPSTTAAAVLGDLLQGRLAVKVLTAGDEPDFQGFKIHVRDSNLCFARVQLIPTRSVSEDSNFLPRLRFGLV